MKRELRKYVLENPVTAFPRLVLPLIPRNGKLRIGAPALVTWKRR